MRSVSCKYEKFSIRCMQTIKCTQLLLLVGANLCFTFLAQWGGTFGKYFNGGRWVSDKEIQLNPLSIKGTSGPKYIFLTSILILKVHK